MSSQNKPKGFKNKPTGFTYELVQIAPGHEAGVMQVTGNLGRLTRPCPVSSGDILELGHDHIDDYRVYQVVRVVHPHRTISTPTERRLITTTVLLLTDLTPPPSDPSGGDPEVSTWEPSPAVVTVPTAMMNEGAGNAP